MLRTGQQRTRMRSRLAIGTMSSRNQIPSRIGIFSLLPFHIPCEQVQRVDFLAALRDRLGMRRGLIREVLTLLSAETPNG